MARCIIAAAVVTYVLAVLQTTIGDRMAILGVTPDLLLVWSISIGLLSGQQAGAVTGFASGVVQGALQQAWIGPFAISKMVSGFLAGLLATKMFKENWLVPALCGILLTLTNEVIFLLLFHAGSWTQATRVIGVRVPYHGLLVPIALALTSRLRRGLIGLQKEAI